MKFDELCDFVLVNEAGYDTLTGKAKVFSLSDDVEDKVNALTLNDVKELIRKTTLPFTADYVKTMVLNDLTDYLPAETPDLKTMLKRSVWSKFDDSEKKSKRAAAVLFAFLKKKKIIKPGITKNDDASDADIDSLANDFESDVGETDYNSGLSMRDVSKFGGMTPRSTGHPEDESMYY